MAAAELLVLLMLQTKELDSGATSPPLPLGKQEGLPQETWAWTQASESPLSLASMLGSLPPAGPLHRPGSGLQGA